MQSPREIENVKKKIHAKARKMLWHGIGNFVWASGSERREVGGSCKKFTRGERRAEEQVRLLRACGSAELGKVASGSAMQGLWLGNRKMGSQVIGKDKSQLPGKGNSWESEGEKEEGQVTE